MTMSWVSKKYCLIDSLIGYTDDVTMLSETNPIGVSMNGQNYSVHIAGVHDSGKGRSNKDEQRIQPTRNLLDKQSERQNGGFQPIFIGLFPDGKVFTAWDPAHVFAQNPESGGSIYARYSHYKEVQDHSSALRIAKLTNIVLDATVLSLRIEALGFYLENSATLHDIKETADLRNTINVVDKNFADENKVGETLTELEVQGVRKIVTTTRRGYQRNKKFSDTVLTAYNYSCCICGRQMGLVEAAHIIPHNHPDSTDEVQNGLPLCIEHHRLYDSRLLMPTSGQRLSLNKERVEHLKNIGQDSGLDDVIALDGQKYRIPDDKACRPDDELLERGIRIRLGTDT